MFDRPDHFQIEHSSKLESKKVLKGASKEKVEESTIEWMYSEYKQEGCLVLLLKHILKFIRKI